MGEPEKPLPRDVAGFARARTAGLVPSVPPRPPRLDGAGVAGALAQRVLLLLAASLFALIALGLIAAALPLPDAAVGISVAVAGVLLIIVVGGAWRQVGLINAAELQRGYTTLVLDFGRFTPGAGRRWPSSGHRAPWDYSATWVLNSHGEVQAAPDGKDRDAPGYYPSPHDEKRFELWTGLVWSGDFLDERRVAAMRFAGGLQGD